MATEERIENLAFVLFVQEANEWGFLGTPDGVAQLRDVARECWKASKIFYEVGEDMARVKPKGERPQHDQQEA